MSSTVTTVHLDRCIVGPGPPLQPEAVLAISSHLVRCIVRGVAPPDKPSPRTQVFLSINEVAELLGISVNTAKSYVLKDLFPAPDARIGKQKGWLRKTIKDWNYNRPRPSRATPDPTLLKNNRDRRVRR